MHKHSCQSVSKNVHITVIFTDYKSGAFYLKEYHIEYTSPEIKYCPMEFDIDSIYCKTVEFHETKHEIQTCCQYQQIQTTQNLFLLPINCVFCVTFYNFHIST